MPGRRGIRLRHLNPAGRFPSGNVRFYFRPKGRKGVPMPDLPPDHPLFLAAYAEASGTALERPAERAPGSLDAAVAAFLASEAFASRSAATRANWRRHLDDMRVRYGQVPLAQIQTKHIRADLAPRSAHPANNRLKVWRGLMRWCEDAGRLDVDPARSVRRRATPDGGHRPWTAADVAAFRARWPIGAAERLALELLYRTCASIGDACSFNRGMVRDGWLIYERAKSGTQAFVPWADPPEWFGQDDLDACLELHDQLVFIVTSKGKPRSTKAAAGWFSRACTLAGLPHLSAHGLRKFRAAEMSENGATEAQRKAILGHETDSEARRYARSADLRRIISGTKSSKPPGKLVQLSVKTKGKQ